MSSTSMEWDSKSEKQKLQSELRRARKEANSALNNLKTWASVYAASNENVYRIECALSELD